MIKIGVLTLIEFILFYLSIGMIQKYDVDNKLPCNVNWKVGLIFLLSTTLIYFKFENNVFLLLVYSYIVYYLILTAYVDYKTQYVYSIFIYVTILVGIIYLFKQRESIQEFTTVLTIIIIYSLITYKANMKFNFYANGDSKMYISLTFFICSIYKNMPLSILLINMILANIFAILLNIKNFDFKKMDFKKEIAFAPSIALSTYILILIS